jgi:hypothetical protein
MSQENVEVVREAFEAWLGGDREKTARLLDPAVEFHGTVGGLQEGQIARGQAHIDETFEAEDLEAWESAAQRQRSSSTLATTWLCSCTNTGAVEAAESSWKPRRRLSLRW